MYIRICPNPDQNPNCRKEISYTENANMYRAKKQNTNCKSCAVWNKGIPRTEEEKKKISESHKGKKLTNEHKKNIGKSNKGEKNGMYGKSVYNIWVKKYGKEEADRRQKDANIKNSLALSGENHPFYGKKREPFTEETRKRMSESHMGMKYSEETKKKQRLSMKKRIENRSGQMMPNYNSEAISIIEEYGKKYGFNFQHAENGGEVCIDGYWPDGVDEKMKTIIEIDEKQHFNSDGTYREKDIRRQKYFENLGYKVIRVRI